ncbi:MAG: phage portal protein, partial [Clostridia bacterium]|nr:phage portal protein [Clostridia bacterium]
LGMSEEAAAEWQRIALREFNLWAKTSMCDASRQNTFWEMQELAFRSMLMSGDVFALFGQKPNPRNPYQLVIRLLEADRICTPESTGGSEMKNTDSGGRIVDGVELNKEGEVIKYHIATYHPLADETPEEITWEEIEAFGADTGMPNILHIMTVERPEQHRGIPFISAMIVQIKQLDRYLDAELAASLVAAMLTVFIMNDGTDDDGYDSINDGIQDEDKVTNDSMKIELGNGNIYEMPPGKHIEKVGENRAPTAFDSFVQQVITMIGSSRGIPYEVLMHRYDSNYTASRSAMLDFWKEVRRYRQHFTQRFNQPIYEQWLAEAVALGRIDAPGFFDDPAVRDAWCGCQWIGTSQGHVQPVQEANAARIRMENGISTGEQEAMEYNGSDFMENLAQRKRELKAMAEATAEERTDENAQ